MEGQRTRLCGLPGPMLTSADLLRQGGHELAPADALPQMEEDFQSSLPAEHLLGLIGIADRQNDPLASALSGNIDAFDVDSRLRQLPGDGRESARSILEQHCHRRFFAETILRFLE